LAGIKSIAAGYIHNLAVRADGSVVTWGWNAYGQLGDGTLSNRWTPVVVPGATTALVISGGGAHSLIA
jgi:alpha-tubulin suppressor-like RCC1 family protein